MASLITLLTDFGDRDGFVGVMKGVILGVCPEARLVDLTHEVEPGDVAGGALLMRAAARFFPPGTIHLGVVDPGVGSERRPIALSAGGQRFVGPDNGLLWAAASDLAGQDAAPEARLLANPDHRLPWVSATFHGRDLFAPAAAHLARGASWASLGPPVADPVPWEPAAPQRAAGEVTAEILWIDRYGNAITNLSPADAQTLGASWRLEVAGTLLTPVTHYAAVPPGDPLLLLGSLGLYEIAVNRGSAALRLGLRRGDPVRVFPIE